MKCYMMIGTTECQSGSVPQFGLLYDIIIYGQEPNIVFVFNKMETLKYDSCFGAYEVVSLAEYCCFYRSSIKCYHLFSAIQHGNHVTRYIKSKYDLTVYCNY